MSPAEKKPRFWIIESPCRDNSIPILCGQSVGFVRVREQKTSSNIGKVWSDWWCWLYICFSAYTAAPKFSTLLFPGLEIEGNVASHSAFWNKSCKDIIGSTDMTQYQGQYGLPTSPSLVDAIRSLDSTANGQIQLQCIVIDVKKFYWQKHQHSTLTTEW